MRFLMVLLGVSLVAAKPVSLPEVAAELCPPMGVAPEIALRVMRVESNCRPYAIGVQMQRVHQGYFPPDSVTARATLKTALSYTRNIGIGPMQINWRVWGEILGVSPEALLDTRTNILVGCGLLGRHLQGQGPLDRRIGRYHSLTPERSQAYGKRVLGATPCTD
jgi:hypothetical protein